MSTEPSAEELRTIKSDLTGTLKELTLALAGLRESAKPVDLDMPIGRLSRVDAMQQQSMAKANRKAVEQRVQRIRAALKRIETGDFGYCLTCDDNIALKRLKARPETTTCLSCQAERESR